MFLNHFTASINICVQDMCQKNTEIGLHTTDIDALSGGPCIYIITSTSYGYLLSNALQWMEESRVIRCYNEAFIAYIHVQSLELVANKRRRYAAYLFIISLLLHK